MKKTIKLLLSSPLLLLIISCDDSSVPQSAIDDAVLNSNKPNICFSQNFARQFPSVIDQGMNKTGSYRRDVLDGLVSSGFLKSESKQIEKKQFGKVRTKSVIVYSMTKSGKSEFEKNDAFCFAALDFRLKNTSENNGDITVDVIVSHKLYPWATESNVISELNPISNIIKKPDWEQKYRFVNRDGEWLSSLICGSSGNVCKG